MLDPSSGLLIPQARVGFVAPEVKGTGHITYRCHTCGDLIVKPWETLYVDDGWCSTLSPLRTTPRTTTHHVWHLSEDHDGE